ncbi:MAG: PAS domain-containing protein [Actinomycetota bacterium]
MDTPDRPITSRGAMSTPGSELRRLRSLVADLDAVVWEADAASCRFTFVSEGSREILGYAPQSWLADPTFWADHVHPDDRSVAVREFMRAATDGAARDSEYRFIAQDGEVVWVRDIGHVILDDQGKPLLVRGLMIDISTRHALEEQHRDAETRYRALVERLPAIVYIEAFDGESPDPGRLLYVSPKLEEILGFEPAEWLDDPVAWRRQFHPDDEAATREAYINALDDDEPFTADYRMFHRDGRIVWIRDDSVLVRDERGTPLFWQGVMYDITAHRDATERAEGSEARYRALVEQLPAIVYTEPIGDDSMDVSYIGPRSRELLGIDPAEWMADPDVWLRTIHPDDRERVRELNAVADRDARPFLAEYRMISRDGRTVWFHDEAALVRDEHGHPLHWQGVMIDITEQKRADDLERDLQIERETAQRLREVDEMKNTFLQAVSHDLRTPLAAILGLAITMGNADVSISADEVTEMSSRIASNARKLDRLVTDLLDLDRLSRGIIEPVLRPTDVGHLVASIVAESDLLGDRTVDVDTAPVIIPVDAAKLERIVENLLANSAKHTPPDARVWVRIEGKDGGAVLTVEDDGPGVPPDLQAEIFEAFRRGPSSSEHSPGVGVGLSLVARFAELHAGRAWVEDRPGGGASFKVFLGDASAPVG